VLSAAEECDYIINKATPRLHRSQVVSSEKSDNINKTVEELSDVRTSQGMFFERGEDDMIKCEPA
jgi:prolyl 4-hydroxylase